MFDINKPDDLKNKTANLADSAKENFDKSTTDFKRGAEDLATDVKRGVQDMGQNLHASAADTKHEALGVINSLKALLAQYTSSSNVQELKHLILDKAYELKGTVSDEVSHVYHAGKDRAVHTVQEKPLLSLGLAVGAGVLLGYILGTKNSSK